MLVRVSKRYEDDREYGCEYIEVIFDNQYTDDAYKSRTAAFRYVYGRVESSYQELVDSTKVIKTEVISGKVAEILLTHMR